jgi:hypothetical protein
LEMAQKAIWKERAIFLGGNVFVVNGSQKSRSGLDQYSSHNS